MALVNALDQANRAQWNDSLRRLDLIAARASQSADAVAAGAGKLYEQANQL